jgi:hypothetical protein
MKKTLNTIILVVTATLLLSSCEFTRPIAVTSNPIGSKVGISKTFGILFFPPFVGMGNTGVVAAAKQGGITKISTVDLTRTDYIIFNQWTCTVTGE